MLLVASAVGEGCHLSNIMFMAETSRHVLIKQCGMMMVFGPAVLYLQRLPC